MELCKTPFQLKCKHWLKPSSQRRPTRISLILFSKCTPCASSSSPLSEWVSYSVIHLSAKSEATLISWPCPYAVYIDLHVQYLASLVSYRLQCRNTSPTATGSRSNVWVKAPGKVRVCIPWSAQLERGKSSALTSSPPPPSSSSGVFRFFGIGLYKIGHNVLEMPSELERETRVKVRHSGLCSYAHAIGREARSRSSARRDFVHSDSSGFPSKNRRALRGKLAGAQAIREKKGYTCKSECTKTNKQNR